MKCSVEGCHNEDCGQPIGNDEFRLCQAHWNAWGYFHTGYECGHFGSSEVAKRTRLNRKRWRKAMLAFLDWCRIEISAFERINEAYIKVKG